ncbi:hypothetical protein jhhlp_000255 [Lomentospora prolificans]|uniref:Tafazzin family protein n=1 Tax=Lomentospora prolificans TaxID=41688 RepID=A0A2N3NKF5_9PEZI|nr:hypothetical protein jhhlp_000255 [Lomentospora prolificans]
MSPPTVPRRAPRGAFWRAGSSVVMGLTGLLGKGFLYGLNRVHLEGYGDFLEVLEKRKHEGRKRGLLTASNHTSVLDDPIIWGVLPLRYVFDPWNLRWSLGAQDICFKNKASTVLSQPICCVHQHPTSSLRYFKWGIARLILESDPTPDFVPMFIDGLQRVMPENRSFPRFLPRVGKDITVAFGEQVDVPEIFGELVERWRKVRHLVGPVAAGTAARDLSPLEPPEGVDAEVWREVVEVRIETARRVRVEVLKLRRSLGYPDDDEKLGLAETWKREKLEGPRKTTLGGQHVSSKR